MGDARQAATRYTREQMHRSPGLLGNVVLTLLTVAALGGQNAQEPYRELKQFLGLGDPEWARLRQPGSHASMELDDSQRRKIAGLAEVLRSAWVYNAVQVGLISKERWAGGILCYDEMVAQGLGLTHAQVVELRTLRDQPRAARLAVLTKSQLARLASYETQLQLVNQAIELGLVSRPTGGEHLCH